MNSLSVVIIAFNEEEHIRRCIKSVKQVADEIIVVDSFSTDDTVNIARSLGATVYLEKFRGYIGQKNLAMQLASNNYILSLDADEALDETLSNSIAEAKKTFSFKAYKMNRLTNYCGRFIHHGLWYPDRKVRLFDRRVSTWGGFNPHDKVQLQKDIHPFQLKGDILHYSFNSTEDLVAQNNKLSTIAAASLYDKGIRSSWGKILSHPLWAFVNGFFFRGGFLDGADGFSVAIHTSYQVFLKHSKLYRLQKAHRKSITEITTPLLPEAQTIGEELPAVQSVAK